MLGPGNSFDMTSSCSKSEFIIPVASSIGEDETQSDDNSMTISVKILQLHVSERSPTLSDAENAETQTLSDDDTFPEYDDERRETTNYRREHSMQILPPQVCRTSKTHKLLRHEHIAHELSDRSDKCTTTPHFTLVKKRFLHEISKFEDRENCDMVVLLRINLACVKLDNNEKRGGIGVLNRCKQHD